MMIMVSSKTRVGLVSKKTLFRRETPLITAARTGQLDSVIFYDHDDIIVRKTKLFFFNDETNLSIVNLVISIQRFATLPAMVRTWS